MTRPFEERIRSVEGKIARDSSASTVSLAQFYQGAALLSGTAYPEWLAQKLAETYKISVCKPYGTLVVHACRLMDTENCEGEGVELLYKLLIEPFLLIRQSGTDDPIGSPERR